jgi:serine/threonine-protein kinase
VRDPSLLALPPGAWFHNRYRVVRCINAGGMGAVYEVVDDKTNSSRALKVILPNLVQDPDACARFALEARVTGGVRSDHIVHVTDADVDTATGMPFLVMDLLDGMDLGAMVSDRGALPPAEVVLYLSQAALALDKTHAAGIVHRDLKPENLFVTRRDDGAPCLKILDFGIAKVIANNGEALHTRPVGTPLYMSPEQVNGAGTIGPCADVYALGQIAYTLLTGEAFWTDEAGGPLFTLLSKIVVGAGESASARSWRRRNARLPQAFDDWFRRVTATDPAARFERATQAVAALGEALGVAAPAPAPSVRTLASPGVPSTAALESKTLSPVSPSPSGAPTSATRRRRVTVAALVLAALGVAGLVGLGSKRTVHVPVEPLTNGPESGAAVPSAVAPEFPPVAASTAPPEPSSALVTPRSDDAGEAKPAAGAVSHPPPTAPSGAPNRLTKARPAPTPGASPSSSAASAPRPRQLGEEGIY